MQVEKVDPHDPPWTPIGSKRVSKGAAEREATKSRDAYRASVADDLSMHHRVIGELVQQVTGLIERVKKLEDDKPKIQVVGSL